MGGVVPFLDEVIVYFLWGEVEVVNGIVLLFEEGLVVVKFPGDRDSADNFNLSAFIDEDVGGVHITYLLL